MVAPGNNEPTNKPNYDGLSYEIKKVIRDEQFQTTVGKFVRKSNTRFEVLKGIGFTVAIASGLFGYLLAANSEADDRRAQMIHGIINEKKEWIQRVNNGLLEIRKVRHLIKYDCDHNRAIPSYEQGKLRFLARYDFVKSFSGTREIFGEEVAKICRELTAFDENVPDVCAKNAPDDEAWRDYLRKINEIMHKSILEDRIRLEQLGNGTLSKAFIVF